MAEAAKKGAAKKGTATKTDPELWDKTKQAVTAGDKGGKPGHGRRARRSSPPPNTRVRAAATRGRRAATTTSSNGRMRMGHQERRALGETASATFPRMPANL